MELGTTEIMVRAAWGSHIAATIDFAGSVYEFVRTAGAIYDAKSGRSLGDVRIYKPAGSPWTCPHCNVTYPAVTS